MNEKELLDKALDYIVETQCENDAICSVMPDDFCLKHCVDYLKKECVKYYLDNLYGKED